MTRVKRGTTSLKTRRNILKQAKGYRFGRSTKERQAKEAINHAGVYAYRDRKKKKGVFRRLWTLRINAASRMNGISYSRLIDKLKKANIGLDRKILSQLAQEQPKIFSKIVKEAK
jgi:large subunit ribosomal protein L20